MGIEHRLGKRKQCLSRAIDRQNLVLAVQLDLITIGQPLSAGLAQARLASGGGVGGQAGKSLVHDRHDHGRCGVPGLANA